MTISNVRRVERLIGEIRDVLDNGSCTEVLQ